MLKLVLARRCAIFFSALCLAACGGALLIIPLFEFSFVSANTLVDITLNPAKPTEESGSFDKDSVRLNIDSGTGPVTTTYNGTYSGCGFELKASGFVTPPAAASYSGRFITKDVIELRRSGEAVPIYTLTRQKFPPFNPTVDFGC
jgi:hypothetical protein